MWQSSTNFHSYLKSSGDTITVENIDLLVQRAFYYLATVFSNIYQKPTEIAGNWKNLGNSATYTFTKTGKEFVGIVKSLPVNSTILNDIFYDSEFRFPDEFAQNGIMQIHNGTSVSMDKATGKKSKPSDLQFRRIGNLIFTVDKYSPWFSNCLQKTD